MKFISKIKNYLKKIKIKGYKLKGLKIGDNCTFVEVPHFGAEPYLVEVGNNITFSTNVHFFTHDGGVKTVKVVKNIPKKQHIFKYGRVTIGDNCFIGHGVTFLANSGVGNNCVVGACSLVTKKFPDNVVVGGGACQSNKNNR